MKHSNLCDKITKRYLQLLVRNSVDKGDNMKLDTYENNRDKQHENGNSILNTAKYSKDNTDEWYTTYETIAEELAHYKNQFKGKIVLCNCDDPYKSNFSYYFLRNFNVLRLKKLICTSYAGSRIDQIQENVQLTLDL